MTSQCKEIVYYGVHIPIEQQIQENDGSTNVFFDKLEALKEVKKYKKARFKAFNFYYEALEFAQHGSEFPNNNSLIEMSPATTKIEHNSHSVGEKPSQFRGPKSQDLVKFRKAIESDNLQVVQSTIWENPRYLISSGDTPAILQEGSRYNALHVAAKAKNAYMCDIILSAVSSPLFLLLLYGEENREGCLQGSRVLLDLYLNTPDKGLNETPLHFAVKFGAADVTEVLVSYPQCNKFVMNKFSQMPKDIICSRTTSSTTSLVEKITSLLEDRYYVPVLRSEDNCVQPTIGEPFSPGSPPALNTNVIDPRMEIHAYAGPMKREEASMFRKKWKTPPRIPGSPVVRTRNAVSPLFRTPERSEQTNVFRLQDTEKGLERVGRNLAKQFHVGWKEYWPFLGTFADLTSEEGLKQLEDYLRNLQINAFSESVLNSINKSDDLEESVMSPINPMNVSDVSKSFGISPITELCKNFEACSLTDNGYSYVEPVAQKKTNLLNLNRFNESILVVLSKSGLSPYLCIEKSCQVFANRIANHIFLVDNCSDNMTEVLESEVKHLKSLIGSYMNDARFNSVNFNSVHWRIANLVAVKIKEFLVYEDELSGMQKILESIKKKYCKLIDFSSSEEDDLNTFRQNSKPVRKKSTTNNDQVICLVESILILLEMSQESDGKTVVTEEECIKIWSSAWSCSCVWKIGNRPGRKGGIFKKGRSFKFTTQGVTRYENMSKDNISRRLSFHDDCVPESKGDSIDHSDLNGCYDKLSNCSNSSSDEDYADANQSPSSEISEGSSCDLYEDPELDDLDVFIEGSAPTKIDYAVFTAIKDLRLDPSEYPGIYRWRHVITLFPEEERMSWPSPNTARYKIGSNVSVGVASTPIRQCAKTSSFTPPHSWLRITGFNSPIRSLNALKGHVSLPYGEKCQLFT